VAKGDVMFKKLRARVSCLLVSERGVMAVVIALSLPILIGITGTAVDLGVVYSARSQLQNAADSAALAGAATMLGRDQYDQAVAQPDVALATAQEYTARHTRTAMVGDPADPQAPRQAQEVALGLREEDFTIGRIDLQTGVWETTGFSSDPGDLTAVRVKLRRDSQANDPVETFFARIFGLNSVPLEVASIAYLGYAGSVGEGVVDLPIAVFAEVLASSGSPECGKVIQFRSENSENAEWTTFFYASTNDNDIRKFVNGTVPIPPLKVGDEIYVSNGQLSTSTFSQLTTRFNQEGEDTDGDGQADSWLVCLPVVNPSGNSSISIVAGFCYFDISEVRGAPDKDLTGSLKCGMVVPTSQTGGSDFGSRASGPKLVM